MLRSQNTCIKKAQESASPNRSSTIQKIRQKVMTLNASEQSTHATTSFENLPLYNARSSLIYSGIQQSPRTSVRSYEAQRNPYNYPAPRSAPTTTMSLTNCRFYEEKYPDIDSFVMVNVKQVCICGVAILKMISNAKPCTDRRNGSLCQAA